MRVSLARLDGTEPFTTSRSRLSAAPCACWSCLDGFCVYYHPPAVARIPPRRSFNTILLVPHIRLDTTRVTSPTGSIPCSPQSLLIYTPRDALITGISAPLAPPRAPCLHPTRLCVVCLEEGRAGQEGTAGHVCWPADCARSVLDRGWRRCAQQEGRRSCRESSSEMRGARDTNA